MPADESALEEYNDWKKKPDFWQVGTDERKPLDIPEVFQVLVFTRFHRRTAVGSRVHSRIRF